MHKELGQKIIYLALVLSLQQGEGEGSSVYNRRKQHNVF